MPVALLQAKVKQTGAAGAQQQSQVAISFVPRRSRALGLVGSLRSEFDAPSTVWLLGTHGYCPSLLDTEATESYDLTGPRIRPVN